MTDKPKRPRDANQLAKFIVDVATGEEPEYELDTSGQRKGGLKGGKARAEKLTRAQREEIATKASNARRKKDHADE
ncbi:histone H1 [uncultured Roseobacter sp.]|uniref:histone H1 n=1 Tax=uncultured Roseobacter sp. TaxID=114847 RepID=UPI002616D47A|nr:histone H1 [uncultured Roseobacter sp.]